jgi:CheY-like chemotaxis protein
MTNGADRPKLILVVEDDTLIRTNIIEVLADEGYCVQGAANGQLALDYLRSASLMPALILLDLMMPVMNGWQFRTEQLNDFRLRKIPVVVVTADGNARQKEKNFNVEGWVKKPFEIETLLTTVKQCCSLNKS